MNAVIACDFSGPIRVRILSKTIRAKPDSEWRFRLKRSGRYVGEIMIQCEVTSKDVRAWPCGLLFEFDYADAYTHHKFVGYSSHYTGTPSLETVPEK